MTFARIKKPITIILIALLILGQVAFTTEYLFTPKPAKAFWGIGDFNFSTIVANWADVVQRIAQGALMRIAQAYANKYLTRFVQKLQDKYKIRDFLYYDRYLSDYYLTNLILKNVSDPDLRTAFDLMTRATITGQTGGYTGVGTDPAKALIPKIKQAIANVYINQGGIDSSKVYNPLPGVSDIEYFQTAQAYFSNPPSFTEQNLQAQFGAFQSSATTASQLEIMVGNGLKAGRVIGGRCVDDIGPIASATDPVKCVQVGGTWQASLLDQARSFIDNPTAVVSHFTESALNRIFDTNYDPTNIWTAVGSALGNFVFTQLNLDKSGGTFNETGSNTNDYKGDTGSIPMVRELDLDGDNVPDGQTSDGITLETCYHGGVAPNCKGSKTVVSSPYFTPICDAIDRSVTALGVFADFMDAHADQMKGGGSLKGKIIGAILLGPVGAIFGGLFGKGSIDDFVNKADADIWARRANLANSSVDDMVNAIQSYHSPHWDNTEIALSRYTNFMSNVIQSLQKDQDLDLATFGSGGGGLENLMKNTAYILRYIQELKLVIGKCENPNIKAAGAVPAPQIGPGGEEPGPTCDEVPGSLACKSTDHSDLVTRVKNYLISKGQQFNTLCDAFEIVKRVAWALRGEGTGLMTTGHTTQCNGYSADIVAYSDNSGVDILIGAGPPDNTNGPTWQPMPPSTEAGVHYAPPSDPGDPAGSY